jgi:LysM repeat protein
MRLRLWLTGVLLVLLSLTIGLAGCERAKPAPTPTKEAQPTQPTGMSASPTSAAPGSTAVSSPQPSAPATEAPSPGETATAVPSQPAPTPEEVSPSVPTEGIEHVVAWGETINIIADRYGVSVEDIVAANNLSDPDLIRAGDVLIIPGVAAPTAQAGVHIVRQGETLQSIASMYGTTVEAIALANGIINTNYIYVGQSLTIPGGGAGEVEGQTYLVQSGDTLSSIAVQFGTTAYAIAVENNLPNVNAIYVGQTLRIP